MSKGIAAICGGALYIFWRAVTHFALHSGTETAVECLSPRRRERNNGEVSTEKFFSFHFFQIRFERILLALALERQHGRKPRQGGDEQGNARRRFARGRRGDRREPRRA